mmetsp:Transcript_35631/g.88647  ORF Transcript_35631/g.88647 Transcript_35631/m.88647 type:complete len:220 (+) Transcript_35631:305-964(+)
MAVVRPPCRGCGCPGVMLVVLLQKNGCPGASGWRHLPSPQVQAPAGDAHPAVDSVQPSHLLHRSHPGLHPRHAGVCRRVRDGPRAVCGHRIRRSRRGLRDFRAGHSVCWDLCHIGGGEYHCTGRDVEHRVSRGNVGCLCALPLCACPGGADGALLGIPGTLLALRGGSPDFLAVGAKSRLVTPADRTSAAAHRRQACVHRLMRAIMSRRDSVWLFVCGV